MSSLRNILQRCARNASIPGSTPLQIQCTFNPVYSAYPTSISRQAYSSDANEAPKNWIDPVRKYFLELVNSRKSRSKITVPEDQKASKSFTADSAQNTSFGQQPKTSKYPVLRSSLAAQTFVHLQFLFQINSKNSPPNTAEDQKVSRSPTFNKDLNLRKYYISVSGLSINTTPESLREFYSQFGEIAFCDIVFPGEAQQFGSVAFLKQEAMDRALNSLPHCIDGKEIKNVRSVRLGKKQLTLQVTNLSPKTTTESLNEFYSRFGWIKCRINQGADGEIGEVTFANQEDMHRALDAQPHVIDGSEVFLKYATFDLDFKIDNVPDGITEKDLIAFYSKYGQLRECRLYKGKTGISHAYVSFSAISEVNRAMADRPHIIGGKPLRIKFRGKGYNSPVLLFVGSLPENVTEETLRGEFSKYGNPIFWEIQNDGHFNQSGPYGIVAYGSEEEALNALNSGPHTIEGAVVDVRKAKEANESLPLKEESVATDKNTLRKTIEIEDVPEGVTKEELIAFYSKYGRVEECRLFKGKTGIPHAFVSFSAIDEVIRAMDDRPHIIGGKPLKIKFHAKGHSNFVSLFVGSLPENVTEETLRNEFSKYGKPIYWELNNDGHFNQSGPYGIVKYATEQEAIKALNSGPHTIEGSVVDVRKTKDVFKSLPGKDKSNGTDENTLRKIIEIRDVPEGVTKEKLIGFYSKYGRVEECRLRKAKTGIPFAYVSFSAIDEINRAMDDRPHIIGGKPLGIKFLSESRHTSVSLVVGSLPENVTEETLREEFAKYGKLVYWELINDGRFNQSGPYGIVKYGSEQEASFKLF
ncbi:RNA recognition motif domain-containing protein [Ditylenchus destructor]|nr:RNA recognition motif domain-containing protein [Ditylenchus destructor]